MISDLSVMIKPERLKKGDTIGIVSPSSPLAGMVPFRVKAGIAMLEKLGFKVKIGKSAFKVTGYTAGTAQERATDINDMFSDSEVKAIICFIGGNHSNQTLEHLDFDLISRNPKIFMGYSDATVLHGAIGKETGLVTFYGPAILTQFAENPAINSYTLEHFEKAIASGLPVGRINPSTEWTDEVLDWFTGEDGQRARKTVPNPGWKWLVEGKANGPIKGGCVTSLMHARGTKYWAGFSGSILFWEIPESDCDYKKGEKVENVDACLTDLKLSGVFEGIAGMVIGRPFGYGEEDLARLESVIMRYVGGLGVPVLYGVDVGHSDPMITIPIGVRTRLDSEANIFEFLESGTK